MLGLLVSVGSDRWAVGFDQAHEVLAAPAIAPLPAMPPALLGICNRRGELLPVVSLTSVLGHGPPGEAERAAPFVVVVDSAEGPAGFPVTGLPQACELGDPVGPGDGPGALAVHRVDGPEGPWAVTLLDVVALLTPARVAGNP